MFDLGFFCRKDIRTLVPVNRGSCMVPTQLLITAIEKRMTVEPYEKGEARFVQGITTNMVFFAISFHLTELTAEDGWSLL